jgi:hypothetical protein
MPEVEQREEQLPRAVAEQWVTVATGLTEARANELALVLTARGVPFQRQAASSGWELWVPLADAPAAATELTLYRRENAKAIGTRPLEEVGAGRAGVLWYVTTLLAVFFALHVDLFQRDWLAAGRLEAGPFWDCEWWRAVTALTVTAARSFGRQPGLRRVLRLLRGKSSATASGWLAVLLAATGRQRAERVGQSPAHRSIGASTAVFAASACSRPTRGGAAICATRLGSRASRRSSPASACSRSRAGGENTDLGAHLFASSRGSGWGLV